MLRLEPDDWVYGRLGGSRYTPWMDATGGEDDLTGLGLSKLTANALRRVGICNTAKLAQAEETQLLCIPEIGRKRLREIKGALG